MLTFESSASMGVASIVEKLVVSNIATAVFAALKC